MRKTKDVMCTIGRDKGKIYRLVEMPAAQAEKWAARAILTLNKSGVQIPSNIQGLGMVGIAILGLNIFLQGNINFADVEPLMDEMLDSVKYIPDHKNMDFVRTPIEGDIEEVATRAWLRSEVIELHTGFSPAAVLSSLISEMMTAAPSLTTPTPLQ